jgi:hypothetical protein
MGGGGGHGAASIDADSEADAAGEDWRWGQRLEDDSVPALRQHRQLVAKICGDALPPVLHLDGHNPVQMAVFALPTFVPATEGKNGVGGFKSRLDLRKWRMPGVIKVRQLDGSARDLWFCDCCPQNVVIKRTAEACYMIAGGCADVDSAQCECVAYCQSVLVNSACDVDEIIEHSPKHGGPDESGMCVREGLLFNHACHGCYPVCIL